MENGDAGILGGIFLASMCVAVIGFAIAVFTIVGLWKMFVKAGQPGWAAIVPVYNLYILVQILGLPMQWFYYPVILTVVGMVLPFIAFLTGLATLVLSFFTVRQILRTYGQSDDTINVVISLFLPFVMTYRVGFGSALYQGPQAYADLPTLPWIDSATNQNAANSPPPTTGSYIPTLSSTQANEQPLVNDQPTNTPPVTGGPSDAGVDMGSLPQMGNNKDQQQ